MSAMAQVPTKMPNKHRSSPTASRPASATRRKALQAAPALALLASAGAVLPGSPAGAAAVSSKTYEVGAFDSVHVDLPASVSIQAGETIAVRASAEKKVLDVIVAEVTGRQLVLRTRGSFETQEAVTIEISVPGLASLTASSASDVTLTGPLDERPLALQVRDSSSVTLSAMNLPALAADLQDSSEVAADGQAGELQLVLAGSSSFSGEELQSRSARITAAGASEASVHAREALAVRIADAASVFYAGSPAIDQSVSFAGTLEPID